jgi:ABC-type dipeptide/oligopeptide/nickel transport system permease component
MNTLVHRVFAGLLHLYPRRHREVFGVEMEGVFSDVLGEAQSSGSAHLTLVATRELLSIMGCGLLARFSAAQEDLMNTTSTGRASWLGALAFGLAFALARWPTFAHWNGGLVISVVAGALGGWLVSLIGAPGRRRLALAGAGAVAFGLDDVLQLAAQSFAQQSNAGTVAPFVVLAIVAEFVIVGAVFGALAGFVDGNVRLGAQLAFVSAMGALLGSALGLGVALGAVMAYKRDTWIDHVLSNIAATLDAVSPYLIGLLAILLLGVTWKWVPITDMRGAMSPGMKPELSLAFISDVLTHVKVLLLVYVLSSVGSWMLQMKSSTVATLGEDYVTVARARGLPDSRILTGYVGRNATLPLFTRLAISIGFVVGGSVLLESLFTYRGVGFLLAKSIAERDYPVMQGVFLIITAAVVFANLFADFVYGWLDPRIRIAGGEQ